ncbi:hypothetical protein [Methylocella sp. CPCC 101449]|uniref:hypothetical protein n=1 Tax=Methylocella sp. CPCC 101449 TaxID=2987531 RepID=UPI00288E0B6C|nr:hypothetical protein [Methylocella sp. CPCC 101449]MDT2020187.1 hypothetical protein [Methylocella sp. CPCC 101449]
MRELLEWLKSQKGGVSTYWEFQLRALKLRTTEPDQAACLSLLADIAGRFADKYYEEPLPVDAAAGALDRLGKLLGKAVEHSDADAATRLRVLNEISISELEPS